jgi:hypothetical protein
MNSNNYDWKIMETKFDLKTIEANKNTINPNEIINLKKFDEKKFWININKNDDK